MRIALMGSGGVGGFYGGRLANVGYDVSFVARGAHLAAMRERGLTIENEPQGDIHLPKVNVTDDPATIGLVDLVIIAVKLWDTDAAAKAVKPIVGPRTAVLSLQNGVIKDDIFKETVAVGRALGVALPENFAEDRLALTDRMPEDMTTSMHYDLERGNPLEVEWLSGGVVQLGKKAGVPTPANRAVWDILALNARGRGGT